MLDKIIKWIGRIFAASLIIVVVMFVIGESGFDFDRLKTSDVLMLIALFIMCLGAAIGFFKPLVGSVVIIIGYSLFAILEGKIFPGPIYPQFIIVALLYSYTGMQK